MVDVYFGQERAIQLLVILNKKITCILFTIAVPQKCARLYLPAIKYPIAVAKLNFDFNQFKQFIAHFYNLNCIILRTSNLHTNIKN
jgi:hypothetical protein